MKKYIIITLLFELLIASTGYAQVGMNTNGANKDAALDLNNSTGTNTKGLLLPKVSLSGTTNASPLTAHIKGMHVYNTATAGTGATIVTPGEYYNDGIQWLRVSENVWELAGNANTTAGTNFIGTTDNNDVVVKTNNAEVIRITTAGNVGVGTNSPKAKLDIRTNPANTTDPGPGYIGIGTTAIAANTAGAGAIRYNTQKAIEYSNGVVWNRLVVPVTKTVVSAKKTTKQVFAHNYYGPVTDWLEISDNNNTFNPAPGVFKAPRDGKYTISFSFAFEPSYFNWANSMIQAIISSQGTNNTQIKSTWSTTNAGTSYSGAMASFVFDLKAGDTITPNIWQNSGVDKTLMVGVGTGWDGFVNFSVAEL